ncbi:DUF6922 domain-containing protein [Filimonas effusa]|uniref:DUF6922 domain-containing protein n=1 Tax=Filimonas effusa TaxID=2508721 RepID=A0A4Q1CZQ6_9BACT|nr:hypothetical protein [Filimonas effusa]RXK80806.1 hypothetical protein ESB13_21855 [Filimonas effusa]
MKRDVNIATIFPSYLFWDMKPDRLDVERDMNLIIPRALYYTDRNSFKDDIAKLESIYSNTEIATVLQHTKEKVPNTVCELIADRYHIPRFKRFSLAKRLGKSAV